MTEITLRGWLLVTLAIIGLALAVPVVSAHGGELTQANETGAAEPPAAGTVDMAPQMVHHTGAADEMATQMGAHMGLTVDEMATQMGVPVDEMPHQWEATGPQDRPHDDYEAGRMGGYGHGC